MSVYEMLSKMRKSSIRYSILELLHDPKTVMDVAKSIDKHKASVSRAIIDMTKDGLLECLNPSSNNFRYYKITQKGKELLSKSR